MFKLIGMFFLLIVVSVPVMAETNAETYQNFEKIFTDWTTSFNQKDLAKSCQLFSKSVVADYQNHPQKNYDIICDGFKKIFTIPNQRYEYQFKLHQVYQSGNLAAVRITWYLKLFENNKLKSETQDEGIDIFEKDSSGQWKIVNYLGYGKENLVVNSN